MKENKKVISNIVLYGISNTGKSTTLRILYYLLSGKMACAKDSMCSTVYKGYNIGVAFNGDTLKIVEENVAFFEANDFDITVSSTRTEGGPVLAMNYFNEKIFQDAENIIWKHILGFQGDKSAKNLADVKPVDFKSVFPQSYGLAVKIKEELIDKYLK